MGCYLGSNLYREIVGCKGLNYIGQTVVGAYISQDGLIERACYGEFAHRVLTNLHVGETLVRQGLDDGGRNFGQTSLGVVAVPEITL